MKIFDKRPRGQGGFSYLELLTAATVLAILATAAVPMFRWDAKRRREVRLRSALELMRTAIDQYNKYIVSGLILTEDLDQCAFPADRATCYPPTLETLVEGVEVGSIDKPEVIQFLARIPIDPMLEEARWGLRSYQDDWDSDSWGGENVFDVYSLSEGQALDGTYYRDW